MLALARSAARECSTQRKRFMQQDCDGTDASADDLVQKSSKRRRRGSTPIPSGKGEAFTISTVWGEDENIYEQANIAPHIFEDLLTELEDTFGFGDGATISAAQRLLIFLSICGGGHSVSEVARDFGHSRRIIISIFHDVVECLLHFHLDTVTPPSSSTPNFFDEDPDYAPFGDAVGAIGRCYVPIHLDAHGMKRAGAWSKDGTTCQYVLAACDFDMNFTFVFPGWEGSASDRQVINSAYAKSPGRLDAPPGRYYLADRAYDRSDSNRSLLVNYSGTRIFFADLGPSQKPNGRRFVPFTPERCFNHLHAPLLHIIDQTFEVLQGRFPILTSPLPDFSTKTQIDLIFASTAVHNFINSCGQNPCQEASDVDDFIKDEDDDDDLDDDNGSDGYYDSEDIEQETQEEREARKMKEYLRCMQLERREGIAAAVHSQVVEEVEELEEENSDTD